MFAHNMIWNIQRLKLFEFMRKKITRFHVYNNILFPNILKDARSIISSRVFDLNVEKLS